MSRVRLPQVFLAFAVASLPAMVLADDGDLRRWLGWVSERPDLSRSNKNLLAWRQRHPQLEIELLGLLQRVSDPATRRGAVIVLGTMGETPATARALRALSADVAAVASPAVARVELRMQVLATLRSLRALAATPPGSEGAAQLERVAGSLTPPATRELLELLGDPLFDASSEGRPLRSLAARLCGWAGGEEASRLLEDVARRPLAGEATRRACLLGLRRRGLDGALAGVLLGLRERPQDWDLLVRGGLPLLDPDSRAFRHLCKTLLSDDGGWPDLQVMLAEQLARQGVKDVVPYLESLARQGKGFDRRGRLSLLVSLLRLDRGTLGEHLPQLIDYALAADDGLASRALEALVELRPPGLGQRLSDLFNRPDPGGERRVRAAQLIELLGLQGQTPTLGGMVTDSATLWSVRQAAAHALGELGNAESVVFLAQALGQTPGAGPAAALRRELADALGANTTRTSAGRRALEVALLDDEPTVRRSVLRALGRYGDPRCRPHLERLFRLPPSSPRESQARLSAAAELGLLDDGVAPLLLGLWRFHPRDADTGLAVVAYGRDLRPGQVIETLLDLLLHPSEEVGRAAVSELIRRYPRGRAYGYDAPGATARRRAVLAWREAWEAHPTSFR